MPRRPVFRIDPTAAASRTIAASAAGNVKQLETDFKTDKAIKDTKVAALEADKLVKDTKIATLESDKNDKDTRVAALESDKNAKDTKMSTMESDMTSLTSRVSTLESSGFDTSDLATKVSLGNLATRVTSLETLGISGISNAVSWTNLTEINLSGEKLTNGDFGDLTKTYFTGTPTIGMKVEILREALTNNFNWASQSKNPFIVTSVSSTGINVEASDGTSGFLENQHRAGANSNPFWQTFTYELTNWSVHSGTLDQTKLSSGIVDGTGGAVAIVQTFAQSIPTGTELIFKATRNDNNTGNVRFNPIRVSDGVVMSVNIGIDPSIGYASYTTTVAISGVKLDTLHGLREVSSASVFQGKVSGGTVQAYAGGGLEKISGANGWNAGASSVQKIDGNSDGYVQFQWAKNSLEVGLAYTDDDYAQNIEPYFLRFYSGGRTVASGGYDEQGFATVGDWFRIRHYASTNEVKFQKKQAVYSQNTNFVFQTASGSNYSYPSASRPKVISLDGSGTLTIGELYEVYTVRASDQALYLRDLDGNAHGYHGQGTRGIRFEVVEEAGQDYVTFQTANTLSNGSDLYVDTSFYHVESRINDVTIVT